MFCIWLLMSNMFSPFNPATVAMSMNWGAPLIMFALPSYFWASSSAYASSLFVVIKGLSSSMKSKALSVGSAKLFLISVLVSVAGMNGLGLLPYVFTNTAHLSTTLALSFPVWVGYSVLNMTRNFSSVVSRLVPKGTPSALVPLMVFIELISLLIRPLTLSVRLSANMTSGHLLLLLSSKSMPFMKPVILASSMIMLTTLSVLELAVSYIQAHVFMMLTSIYLEEVVA